MIYPQYVTLKKNLGFQTFDLTKTDWNLFEVKNEKRFFIFLCISWPWLKSLEDKNPLEMAFQYERLLQARKTDLWSLFTFFKFLIW